MKVYLGCSAQNIKDYAKFYLAERESILSLGNTITRDWILNAIDDDKKSIDTTDRSHMYDDVMRAIQDADLVVFDCSVPAMSVGHQITFAVERYKPTLILVHKNHKLSTSLFLAGSNSPYLTFKDYKTEEQAKSIVAQFLKEKEPNSKVRFNLVLDRELDNYVEWLMFKRKITKTDALKSMIKKELLEDHDYSEYLGSIKKKD
jgi:hypothetical protein